VEARRPDAGDQWHVLADGETAVYERWPGEFELSLVKASTLIDRDACAEVDS
jgi:hypothetical protein